MMEWFYLHVLVPVLNVAYVPCDWVLGWTEHFSPIVSISIVSVLSGVAMVLVLKYASNQKFLGQAKADLALLKLKMKAAKEKGDQEALGRARALSGRIGGKFMGASLKPSLWTVPIMAVLGLWTGSRLGYLPIHTGDEFSVVAHFEDNAKGFAYVMPDDSIQGAGPLIAPIEIPSDGGGMQARWKLRAGGEAQTLLRIHHEGQEYSIPVPMAKTGGRPPDPVTTVGKPTRSLDGLQAVEIKLAPSLPEAWWNLTWQWGGLYMIVCLVVAMGLRWLLKIN